MNRRDFIKNSFLAAAVSATAGPKALAQATEKQILRESYLNNGNIRGIFCS